MGPVAVSMPRNSEATGGPFLPASQEWETMTAGSTPPWAHPGGRVNIEGTPEAAGSMGVWLVGPGYGVSSEVTIE